MTRECQEGVTVRSQGQGINKRVSRRCQEGVKRASVSRGCQEGVKLVSRVREERTKRVPGTCRDGLRCQEGFSNISRKSQEIVKSLPRGCKDTIKGVSRGSQEK